MPQFDWWAYTYLWNAGLLAGFVGLLAWFHHLSYRESDYVYKDSYRGRYSNAPDEYEDTFIEDESDDEGEE